MPNTKKTEADKAREATAEKTAAVAKADADYRADIKTAGEKRAKALAKYPDGSNTAEQAWNETKSDEDPLYADSSIVHRQKLDTVVDAVRRTGTAGVVGLEEFEAEVIKLVKAEKPGTALAVPEGGRPAEPSRFVGHPDVKRVSK